MAAPRFPPVGTLTSRAWETTRSLRVARPGLPFLLQRPASAVRTGMSSENAGAARVLAPGQRDHGLSRLLCLSWAALLFCTSNGWSP
jgi:hypothetical protein